MPSVSLHAQLDDGWNRTTPRNAMQDKTFFVGEGGYQDSAAPSAGTHDSPVTNARSDKINPAATAHDVSLNLGPHDGWHDGSRLSAFGQQRPYGELAESGRSIAQSTSCGKSRLVASAANR
jgi:hypothetical protein